MEEILKAVTAALVSQSKDIKALQSSLLEMQLASYRAQHATTTLMPLACHSESYFSQNGEDGILSEIFSRLDRKIHTVVEIGAGDGTENNSILRLLNGARCLWVEGSEKNHQKIAQLHKPAIAEGKLVALCRMIDAENINEIISTAGFIDAVDLLSIDIDGNDYWVWQAIDVIAPPVVVMEYNAFYGPDTTWVMEYNPKHYWQGGHIYYGASLAALTKLAERKGYCLVGCDFMGVNAFFVKRELVSQAVFPGPYDVKSHFQPFKGTLGRPRKGKKVAFGPYQIV